MFSETTRGVGVDPVRALLMKPLMDPANHVKWRGNMRARIKEGKMDPPVVATRFSKEKYEKPRTTWNTILVGPEEGLRLVDTPPAC
jgi:hypothetical protein